MTQKFKKFEKKDDRRIKLTDEQKESVRKMRTEGFSMRELAREFKVSRRLIQFTVYPERLEHAKALFKKRRKDARYAMRNYESKASWANRQKELRDRKRKLGLVIPNS